MLRSAPRLPVAIAALLVTAACGDDVRPTPPPKPPADVVARMQAQRDPSTWEDLDPTAPGQRLRDPRTGIAFRRVPAGEFTMGGGSMPQELPAHRVRLTHDLLVAETEVTAGQWRGHVARCGGRPSTTPADDAPAGEVSWFDAVAFCDLYGYRLPTEAEWEHACRGDANSDDAPWRDERWMLDHAWFHLNAAELGPQPVGGKEPNGFGLHDMLGNVWEWTADWIALYPQDGALRVDPPAQPQPPAGAPGQLQGRVVRGGSFFTTPAPQPGDRMAVMPGERSPFYGFRPVVDVAR